MPYAFALLGLVGGSLALGLLGLLAFLSAHLLIKAAHSTGERALPSKFAAATLLVVLRSASPLDARRVNPRG